MIAFDTETNGLDWYHGLSYPFFVTTCDEEGNQRYWEWDVDPLTREVLAPVNEIHEIISYVQEADGIVGHNIKFDVHGMTALCRKHGIELDWPWDKTEDTHVAGHLLHSGHPLNLTDLCVTWLGESIRPLEDALAECVKDCRRVIESFRDREERFGEEMGEMAKWFIAKGNVQELPSSSDDSWKADYWLPRAYAKAMYAKTQEEEWSPGGRYSTVLRDYSNADSVCTMLLWKEMWAEILRKEHHFLYKDRMKALRISYEMKDRGVTYSQSRLLELKNEYQRDHDEAEEKCKAIALEYEADCECKEWTSRMRKNRSHLLDKDGRCLRCQDTGRAPYNFKVPKGHSPNDSLKTFIYDHLKLPPMVGKKSKSGNPGLDADILQQYIATTKPNTLAGMFLRNWEKKKKRATYIGYMNSYEDYGIRNEIEAEDVYKVLHPDLNMCGTATLRWSSSNPNEQNISKKGLFEGDTKTLRYLFGPLPGWEWWSFDAKNIELRIPAYESGQQELIALFEKPKEPPFYGSTHLLNFSVVYPDIWEKELKRWGIEKVGPKCKELYESTNYQWVKNGGFAVQYGAVEKENGWGTADIAFHKQYAHRLLKSRFDKLEELNQKYIRFARKHGYVETLPDRSLGNLKCYPLEVTRTDRGGILETVPLNYHVQSTAMQWTTKAMIRVDNLFSIWRESSGFNAYIVMQVHDELVVAMPRKGDPMADFKSGEKLRTSNLWRARQIQKTMALGGDDIGIPTPVGCEYHTTEWQTGVAF